ncbi:MAG: M24 family metallopeptidase, partial [Candidatus Aminicenantes bacterium]
ENDVFSTENFKNILPLREQAEIIEKMLWWKKENFLPEMMQDKGADMWIVTEEDRYIYMSLVPAFDDGLIRRFPYFLVFSLSEEQGELEQISIGNMDDIEEWGALFPGQLFSYEESLESLVSLIEKRDPQKIAMNTENMPELVKALGEYASRLVSGKDMQNRWIEYRTPQQIDVYETIVGLTHDILAEAFSNKAITPDTTTTTDVDWWVKQKLHDLGFEDVFGPTVMVWRSLEENEKYGDPESIFNIDIPPYCGTDTVIRRGDVLSCDFGIQYLGIETDIQQVGYVLKEEESDVPEGLKEALRRGNRLQDILAAEFIQGRTGNEILFAALEKAKAEDLRPEIYCHPMGSYVYRYGIKGGVFPKYSSDFGPSIGREGHFDEQGNQLPTRSGKIPLNLNTAYAMELDVTYAVPEWDGQDIRIVLEEKVVYTKEGLIFPGGRQTKFHVIK